VVTRPEEALAHEFNPWLHVVSLIETAGHLLGLDEGMIKRIVTPERILEVAVPVRMDSGEIEMYDGLAHPAQHGARTGQGRHPLPPERLRRRDRGAERRHVDQVRRRQHPLRRRQGRRARRPDGLSRAASWSGSRAVTPSRSRR
jgi:hypothetical protein